MRNTKRTISFSLFFNGHFEVCKFGLDHTRLIAIPMHFRGVCERRSCFQGKWSVRGCVRMWTTTSDLGLPTAGSWCQDSKGNRIWLTAVRATFCIVDQCRLRLSDLQSKPTFQAKHHNDQFDCSLREEADLFGPRPRTDVILNGSAWSANSRTATTVETRMMVGPIDKKLTVVGDRYFDAAVTGGTKLSDPARFIHKPIIYEHAYGGWDRSHADEAKHRLHLRNPVGLGFHISDRDLHGKPAPGIFLPGQDMSDWSKDPDVAGYGAIACHWEPRVALAGTYDDTWRATHAPLWAKDFQTSYWCAAPRDQQVDGYLRGGERVRLENLSPHGSIDLRLPSIKFEFQTKIHRTTQLSEGKLATVLLEPDYPRLTMVWQSAIICNRDIDYLDGTHITLKRVRGVAA